MVSSSDRRGRDGSGRGRVGDGDLDRVGSLRTGTRRCESVHYSDRPYVPVLRVTPET